MDQDRHIHQLSMTLVYCVFLAAAADNKLVVRWYSQIAWLGQRVHRLRARHADPLPRRCMAHTEQGV